MAATTVPASASIATGVRPAGRLLPAYGDDRLVDRVRLGDDAAFEAIYDRYAPGLLAFCRHMLGSRHEAEDALQQSFASAYRALRATRGELLLKPWLYTIARNRCLTTLRDRREQVSLEALDGVGIGSHDLATEVQQRADLRELVDDMQRLPDDQRAALVLFELGGHSQEEIASVLGVHRSKVKALVFQAREGLARTRRDRGTPCEEVRKQLAMLTRPVPRRGALRGHLDQCSPCSDFASEIRRQRRALALVLPVVPSAGLKASVLSGIGASAGAAGGAAAVGSAAAGAGAMGAAAGGGAAVSAGTFAATGASGLAATVGASATGVAGGLVGLSAKGVVAKVMTVAAVTAGVNGAGPTATFVPDTTPAHVRAFEQTGLPGAHWTRPTHPILAAPPNADPRSGSVSAAPSTSAAEPASSSAVPAVATPTAPAEPATTSPATPAPAADSGPVIGDAVATTEPAPADPVATPPVATTPAAPATPVETTPVDTTPAPVPATPVPSTPATGTGGGAQSVDDDFGGGTPATPVTEPTPADPAEPASPSDTPAPADPVADGVQ